MHLAVALALVLALALALALADGSGAGAGSGSDSGSGPGCGCDSGRALNVMSDVEVLPLVLYRCLGWSVEVNVDPGLQSVHGFKSHLGGSGSVMLAQ